MEKPSAQMELLNCGVTMVHKTGCRRRPKCRWRAAVVLIQPQCMAKWIRTSTTADTAIQK